MEDGPPKNRTKRRGAAVFETILVLPVLAIGLFSITEFSMLVNRQQHLVDACRNGAVVASTLDAEIIEASASGQPPIAVRDAIQGRLADVNIDEFEIHFSYGIEAQRLTAETLAARGCDADVTALGKAARVSVTVPATELTPDLLGAFGFDISERTYSATTTFPYDFSP